MVKRLGVPRQIGKSHKMDSRSELKSMACEIEVWLLPSRIVGCTPTLHIPNHGGRPGSEYPYARHSFVSGYCLVKQALNIWPPASDPQA